MQFQLPDFSGNGPKQVMLTVLLILCLGAVGFLVFSIGRNALGAGRASTREVVEDSALVVSEEEPSASREPVLRVKPRSTRVVQDSPDTMTEAPPAPLIFRADPHAATEVVLAWSPLPAGCFARIERHDMERDIWPVVGHVAAAEGAEYIDQNLVPGNTYRYRLVAYNGYGPSQPVLSTCYLPLPMDGGADVALNGESNIPRLPAPAGFRLLKDGQTDAADPSLYQFVWPSYQHTEGNYLPWRTYRVYANEHCIAETTATRYELDPTILAEGEYRVTLVNVDTAGRESERSFPHTVRVNPTLRMTKLGEGPDFDVFFEVKRVHHDYGARAVPSLDDVEWNTQVSARGAWRNPRVTNVRPSDHPEVSRREPRNGADELTEGAYRIAVRNHDNRARNLDLLIAQVFVPMADGQLYENDKRLVTGGRYTVALKADEKYAYTEEIVLRAPEEPGVIRVELIEWPDMTMWVSPVPLE